MYYQYDAAGAGYSWGHLREVWNANSATQFTSIDPLGRVTASNQQTAGEWYGFTYSYNLAGGLYYERYPSGRGVSTSYDGANRASGVSGSYNGSGTNYVANVSYLPHGAPFYYVLGNQLWRVLGCNSRLQPVEIYDAIGNGASAFLLVQCWNWNGPNGGLSV